MRYIFDPICSYLLFLLYLMSFLPGVLTLYTSCIYAPDIFLP
jgi:hypothetical protein